MKTINFLFGLSLLWPTFASAQNEVTQKPHKLQLGTFVEIQKEFRTNPMFDFNNIVGTGCGIAARYRLSNTFSIATGIGVSVSFYKYEAEPMQYYSNHYEPTPAAKEKGQSRQYSLRLPITLQTNLYRQKFFISAGLELYKNLIENSTVVYTEVATGKTSAYSATYKGGSVDAQFLAGLGWNFNAFNKNVFSLETNLKMYYVMNGYTAATSGSTYSPSIRLNWYFIK